MKNFLSFMLALMVLAVIIEIVKIVLWLVFFAACLAAGAGIGCCIHWLWHFVTTRKDRRLARMDARIAELERDIFGEELHKETAA